MTMKNHLLPIITLFMFLCCVSCHTKHRYDGGLQTKIIKADRVVNAPQSKTDRLEMSVSLEYPVAHVSPDALKSIQTRIKLAAFGEDYSEFTAEQAVKEWMNVLEEDYKDENRYLSSEDSEEEIFDTFSEEFRLNGMVGGIENGIMSYELDAFAYTGGAHGLETVTWLLIDLHDGRQITLADLFPLLTGQELAEKLRSALLEQKGMTEAELFELGYEVEAVYPTENFFLRNDSVIFQFNPYDIAPYAEGPQQIALKRE